MGERILEELSLTSTAILTKSPDFLKRMKCSNAEKQEVKDAIKLLGKLSDDARNHGLLFLRNYLSDETVPAIIKKWIKFQFDATEQVPDPNGLLDMCVNYLLLSDLQGVELLKNYISIKGMLLIQSGTLSDKICDFLENYLF